MSRRGAEVCRACLGRETSLILPLGDHPVANAFLSEEELARPEVVFPLDLYVCGGCALLQIPNHVPPDFFKHYLYVPSAADASRRHFAELAGWLLEQGVAPAGGCVVDVGCNDGLMLSTAARLGLRAVGIDPANNLAPLARAKGIEVIESYFDEDVARSARARLGPADVITCTNTLNHIDDLQGFALAAATLLADQGAIVIEVPGARELIAQNLLDTVYHEHLSQFSLRSLVELFAPFELDVTQVHPITMHGGSMRVVVTRRGRRPTSPVVGEWLESERRAGLFEAATYVSFRERAETNRDTLVGMLQKLVSSGHRLAGYGAPAKGNTLLNYGRIGPDTLAFLADRSPLKQGRYSPGMRIPVVPPSRIEDDRIDGLLVLAWNVFDEIREQQAEFRARGGLFVVPIPTPKILLGISLSGSQEHGGPERAASGPGGG